MPRHKSTGRPRPHYFINLGLGIAVLLVFGLSGARSFSISSAATANPYGYADYCALENNTTVIYGWAADPNASSLSGPSVTINAGGEAVTVPTNRAGYRDAAVNAWIDQNRTGDPKPGTYGFRATLPGLYKGSRNIITGTVLNQGPGSSVILTINNSSYVDGDPGKPFFANDIIPDNCLATPPPSTPAPTTTPTPTPARQGGNPETPSPTQQSNVSSAGDADAVATAGTLAAQIAVQADGAKSAHINYGISPVRLDQSTRDQPVALTDPTLIAITGLNPSVEYSYQVVRTYPDGKITRSSIENFTTLAYVVAVHFVDNHTQGIQGIRTAISDHARDIKTSNDEGTAQFIGIPEGLHTIYYSYRGIQKSRQITITQDIVSPDQAAAPHVVTLDFTINIEKAADTAAAAANHTGLGIAIAVALLVLAAATILLFVRRRKNQQDDWYDNPPMPDYPPLTPTGNAVAPPPRPAHTGESLKDMVLRGMAEEAKRKDQK